jgi:hypothetical protein
MQATQFAVQFPASYLADLDDTIESEGQLITALITAHCVDSHDFGSGVASIFIHKDKPLRTSPLSEPSWPLWAARIELALSGPSPNTRIAAASGRLDDHPTLTTRTCANCRCPSGPL